MWSCQGNMPKYYQGLRDILLSPSGRVIYLSDLGNYLDKTTLLYKYTVNTYCIWFLHEKTLCDTLKSNQNQESEANSQKKGGQLGFGLFGFFLSIGTLPVAHLGTSFQHLSYYHHIH